MKTKPYNILFIAECLAARKQTILHLKQFLIRKVPCSDDIASSIISDAIQDEIVIPVGKRYVRLLTANDITVVPHSHDLLCFECFMPGELTNCRQCWRAYHSSCFRKNPEKPIYAVRATNIIAKYQEEEEEDDDNEAQRSNRISATNFLGIDNIPDSALSKTSTINSQSSTRRCRIKLVDVNRYPILSDHYTKEEVENKYDLISPDVVCMGEIRPPTRQRVTNYCSTPNNSLKDENNEDDGGEIRDLGRSLCTCCRAIESGKITQPPDRLASELCHLISYTFNSSRKWLKGDIHKMAKNMNIPKSVFSVILKKLFPHRNVITPEIIGNKIRNSEYNLLSEILIDVLELQYSIGVLFGGHSEEFERSKYFVRDFTYDFAEIRRCPDCVRYSCDRLSPMWFAFPCLQRHELVFAKCVGHSYWPAKVVRVLKKAEKYDVRFFGWDHKRSIISARNILPIETDGLANQKSPAFKRAMDELYCYQALAKLSSERFRYNVNKSEINQIVESVMIEINNKYGMKVDKKNKRRKSESLVNSLRNVPTSFILEDEPYVRRTSLHDKRRRRNSPPRLAQLEGSSNVGSLTPITPVSTPTLIRTTTTGTITIEEHLADMNALRQHLAELHQRELEAAKRKAFCIKCLQPAKLLCCIRAWYCSQICQRQHWFEGHENECCNHLMGGN